MAKKITNLERVKRRYGDKSSEIQKELVSILDYYDEKGYSTQTLHKNIFPAFFEANLCGDLFERTLAIRKIGLSITKEKHILMRGEKLGSERWEAYRSFQSLKNTKEYKKKHLGWSDEDFDKYNKSRSVTLENCIRRHGKEKGIEVFESYKEKQRNNGCSLKWFQEKYGDEEGKAFYESVNAKKANTLENYINRYGESGSEKYLEYMEKAQSPSRLSKSSQELFRELDKYFTEKTYFGEKNKEFGKYDKVHSRYYYYDFVIPDLKVCVEFNGDDWHANPEIYKDKKWVHPFNKLITKEEIWEYDRVKKELLENEGFTILYVWEKEYLMNKEAVIEKLVKEILDARNN